jgi:TP901 family phage tail tape measure protein
MAAATEAVLKFEAGLILTGAAIVGVSIAAADKFDTAFREIATLTGQTSEALSGFRQDILDYASGSTQSLEQVTQAIYAAISGGVDYTQALSIVSQAEYLAVASKAELGTTLTGLVSTLNAYGEKTDQAGRYSDVFFTIVWLIK